MQAHNSIGYSDFSPSHTVVAADPPSQPDAPVKDQSQTTTSQIAVTWSAPLDNRGSAITSYVLQWKEQSAGDYTNSYVTSDATETSYIIDDSGITGGTFYDIRVVAFNVVGGSDPSGAVRIVAATRPTAPG